MAAKRKRVSPVKRGPRGKIGPAGPPGANHRSEIADLAAQVAQIVKELRVQLTRISQIQFQLDRFMTGQSPAKLERRAFKRTNN